MDIVPRLSTRRPDFIVKKVIVPLEKLALDISEGWG
jgi:hypothetical protein